MCHYAYCLIHQILCNFDTDCRLNTDLVFVLDESGSITERNFQEVKTFVHNFTKNLLADNTINKVGIITFSNTAIEHIALKIGRAHV